MSPGAFCDPAQLVDEVHVPRSTPEFPVGRALQPDVALHLHDLADRVILDRAQLLGGELAGGELFAGCQQLLRPQQAAHVVGAERWNRAAAGGRAGARCLCVSHLHLPSS